MTEAEWLACADPTDPIDMLKFINGNTSERKLRLFAVACCHRIWHLLQNERSRQAVNTAERFADHLATQQELESVQRPAYLAVFERSHHEGRVGETAARAAQEAAALATPDNSFVFAVSSSVSACCRALMPQLNRNRKKRRHKGATADELQAAQHAAIQCDLILDIFGNPFRSVALAPSCLTLTVISLAQAIYDERAFDRMPILADALEDGGCNHDDMLAHCRLPGVHVRGCWVLDLIMGKE